MPWKKELRRINNIKLYNIINKSNITQEFNNLSINEQYCIKSSDKNNLDYRLLHVPYVCLEMSIEYNSKLVFAIAFISGVIGRLLGGKR